MENRLLLNLYDETLRLLEDARDYHRHWEPIDRAGLAIDDGFALSRECLSMTARLTSVMAWVMTRRAVQAGEISAEEAAGEHNRLLAMPIHLRPLHDRQALPRRLWRLLDSSNRLYLRVRRLDHQRRTH